MFNVGVRLEARFVAREMGYSRREVRAMLGRMSDEKVNAAREQYKLQVPAELDPAVVDAAFGDGAILKAILDFLKSPEGQMFIKFIIGLFMAL